MKADVEDFLQRVRRLRAKHIPASAIIVAETFVRLGITSERYSAQRIRAEFNGLLREVFKETLDTLESYERPTYAKAAVRVLTQMQKADVQKAHSEMRDAGNTEEAFEQAVQDLIEQWYYHFRQLFLSVSQSRKTRGGTDFELQLAELLKRAEFPFEAQHKQHRVDFMLPDYQHYARDRTQCVLLSAKRTLRERWQQVVDELHKMNCPNVYLATTDEKISTSKMNDISARNIKLVVFDDVKANLFPDEAMVVDFTTLANNVIPQWQTFW